MYIKTYVFRVLYDLEHGAIYDDDVDAAVRQTIMGLTKSPQTMTNIAQAINFMAMYVFGNHGDRMRASNQLVVITDGEVKE